MLENKVADAFGAVDNSVYTISKDGEVKTTLDLSNQFDPKQLFNQSNEKERSYIQASDVTHYFTLGILGVSTWGILLSTGYEGWSWGGQWFKMAAVALVAWGSGQVLQAVTTLPPPIAALFTGILAKYINFLDMREFTEIDSFLRKIYPVVILGKASLGWNLSYMKTEWKRITTLGVMPWCAEVAVVACCTHVLLEFPWLWGILLGSIYASVSCAVVMPSVVRFQDGGPRSRNWPQLVCTAGGIDTALSVGVYGLTYSFIFSDESANYSYKYAKAALTMFAGVTLGVAWGSLAKLAPHRDDFYVTELRVLFVLIGGLFGNFLTSYLGWGGTGGVAVLACNATAAMYWSREGWQLNKNPAATTYRVIWSALEPMVFAYTGTFFVIDETLGRVMVLGLCVLAVCLAVRLAVTWLVCWDFSARDRLYVCFTWMPKTIVEAVLCPLAIDTILARNPHDPQLQHAENLMRLIVQSIIITTPIGYLLTEYLGPALFRRKDDENSNNDHTTMKRKSVSNGTGSGDYTTT